MYLILTVTTKIPPGLCYQEIENKLENHVTAEFFYWGGDIADEQRLHALDVVTGPR